MPLHIRFEGEIAILSNVGRLMNDPRYFDAGREVGDLLSDGCRAFVIELRGVGEAGAPLLGLLMTITRQVRRQGGEVVLAGMSRGMEEFLDAMRMDEFWDMYPGTEEAKGHFLQQHDPRHAR